ncbi:MAG: RtcB family protein [Dictyoglomi bacterium]|nr:RtcB family protein [Dictyoglomota bacterium]HOK29796.1 RtcB family protein [bacterium]HOL54967.1 RtcB family protein [bacterium]HPO82236.1 RtcB family protein [bacterium]
MGDKWTGLLRKLDDFRYEIPREYKNGMRVPGIIYADKEMIEIVCQDQSPEQVANVATLPGIVKYSLAMPDIHWGYGFPIGGVAATRVEDGVISPGGVGYDINCGTRLLLTNLTVDEVKPKLSELLNAIFVNVPSGLGSEGKLKVKGKEFDQVLLKGARWAVENGYGWAEDLERIEENGAMEGADPAVISAKARERGAPQLGTLGSGNHFIEIQRVQKIFDPEIAKIFGLFEDQVTILIHTGSRGFGHQVCTDYISVMMSAIKKYNISLPDRQLACAPIESSEGKNYFSAMVCAANYAWANRQCITHWIRESFEVVFRRGAHKLGLVVLYDVAHNIAKMEIHKLDGEDVRVCVHRKGATRAFPKKHPEIPEVYREVGQPVIIPGDMGRASYILVGTEKAMETTFGSTCHGAGRVMSRAGAKRSTTGREVLTELAEKGIMVKTDNIKGLAEEASEAYKDVERVIEIVEGSGISKRVARMKPMGVIKG